MTSFEACFITKTGSVSRSVDTHDQYTRTVKVVCGIDEAKILLCDKLVSLIGLKGASMFAGHSFTAG